jgi:hypothetical protein
MKLNELTVLADHVAYKTGYQGQIGKEFLTRYHLPTTVTALKRLRAERKEAKRVTDPLATRAPGWVLVEAANRKRARVAEYLCHAFEECGYRLPHENRWVDGSGMVKIHVELGDWPSIRTETEKVWHRKHAWSGNNLRVKVQIKKTYLQDVVAKGLQVVDGKLVLSATEIEPDVYALTLVEQSRGLSLRQTDAYLVRGTLRKNVRSVAAI